MPKMPMRWLLLFLSIAFLGLLLRYFATYNNTFLSEEAPVFFSMMQQTIANNFVVPKVNSLSGFPVHNYAPEEPLLTYLGVLPVQLSGGLISLTYSTCMIQATFSLLGMCIAYLLTKKITQSRKWGLFGMLLFALQPTAIISNAFKTWFGDSFVPILTALSILILLYGLENKNKSKRYLIIGISIMPSLLAYFLWNGGVFAIVTYAFVLIAIFTFKRTKSLKVASVLVIGLIAISWLAYGRTRMDSPLAIPNLVQMLTQTGPVSSTLNLFLVLLIYGTFPSNMLYLIFLVCGFIFTFFLIAICLSKFGAGQHEEKEKIAFAATITLLMVGIPFALYGYRWNALITIPIAVIAGASIDSFNRGMKKKGIKNTRSIKLATFIALVSVIANILFVALMFATTKPPTILTPQYQGTMLWILNNTPKNSTFLTWRYNSPAIEGWAERQSYTDEFDAPNQTKAYDFSRFMFARAYNLSYLDKIKPDYLLVRSYWYVPAGDWASLEREGNLPISYQFLNGTNLQLFSSKPESITAGNVSMQLVYDDSQDIINESIIYSVQYAR